MDSTDSYTGFADVYDLFMDHVPYAEWADRIDGLLREYNNLIIPDDDDLRSEAGLLVELGCGTGTLTRLLKHKGYDCIGIDISEQMLDIAIRQEDGISPDDRILYLNQDMREFELYSTAGAFVCVCNSINYLTDDADILEVFKLVNNYLYPNGLFIFDFNTVTFYRDVLGDGVLAENRQDASYIWENSYDEEDRICEYELTVFKRVDKASESCAGHTEDGPFYRTCETHIQRGYEPAEMKALIEEAGLKVLKLLDADTGGEVTADTVRICMVARECQKRI